MKRRAKSVCDDRETSEQARLGNPLVFLDLDDVLCTNDPYGGFDAIAAVNGQHLNPDAVYRELFAPAAVRALERVHDEMEAGLRYVISSTWRESFTRHQFISVFRCAGLGFVADNVVAGEKWRTPSKFRRGQRVDEIVQWLDRHHQGEPFVIVDDTYSGASLMAAMDGSAQAKRHPFAGRVVLCEENVGLTDAHVQFIVDALRREVVWSPGSIGAAATGRQR